MFHSQNSNVSDIVFGGANDPTSMKSSYSDFASNAPAPRNQNPYENTMNLSSTNSGIQQKYKKTDIFGIHEDTDKPRRESIKRTYFNKSTVFDLDSRPTHVTSSRSGNNNRMASNIFFSDSISAPAAEPVIDATNGSIPASYSTEHAYVPSQGPRSRGTPRIGSPSSSSVSQSEKRHTFGSPNNYLASSVFDEQQQQTPARGARRHYHYQSSDIFNCGDLTVSAPSSKSNAETRQSYSPASYQTNDAPYGLPPKQDYVKSTSFGNIFGDSAYQSNEDNLPRNKARQQDFKDRVDLMTRPGGLSTDQLNRETRGRARLNGPPSNQIWF